MRLTDIKGIGPKAVEKLSVLGIDTVEELAGFVPAGYIDLSKTTEIAEANVGDFVLLRVKVVDPKPLVRRGRRNFFIVYCLSGITRIKLVWYNQPYVAKIFKKDCEFVVYGKLDYDGLPTMTNVKYEATDNVRYLRGISAIYRTRGYFSQNVFGKIAKEAAANCICENYLGADAETRFGLMPLAEAYVKTHSPETIEEGEKAKKRILMEKAFREMLEYKAVREASAAVKTRIYDFGLAEKALEAMKALGIGITATQKNAALGMMKTMASNRALNALLMGDVGSGKTAVAIIIAAFGALCGHQSAVLAPTGILAAQHFANFKKALAPFNINVVLATGSASSRETAEAVYSCDVAIGTQTLLSPRLKWRDLGLLVVDEQHRFGVKQREELLKRGREVDFLAMTATPIPRSLGLAYFGASEVYRLENRVDRSSVNTRVVGRDKRAEMIKFVANAAKCGEKCFVVAPAICDMEGIEMSGVEGIVKEFSKIPDISAGVIHGRMSEEKKEEILGGFSDGKYNVVIATTVVEVGIDVPDLSYMIIMHAERFGLAALHQLRGRIGRSGQTSWCFLYSEKEGGALERLKRLETENDGEKIAELDYSLRGSGELLGLNQSGVDKLLTGLEIADIKLLGEIAEVHFRG